MIYRLTTFDIGKVRLEQLTIKEGSFFHTSRGLNTSNTHIRNIVINHGNIFIKNSHLYNYNLKFEINNLNFDEIYNMLISKDITVIKMIIDIILNGKI